MPRTSVCNVFPCSFTLLLTAVPGPLLSFFSFFRSHACEGGSPGWVGLEASDPMQFIPPPTLTLRMGDFLLFFVKIAHFLTKSAAKKNLFSKAVELCPITAGPWISTCTDGAQPLFCTHAYPQACPIPAWVIAHSLHSDYDYTIGLTNSNTNNDS